MSITFETLGLNPILVEACAALGYTEPTSVQKEVLPHALAGRDLMVSSQTGSGKTAAFVLPILHQLFEALDAQSTENQDESGDSRVKRPRKPLRPTPKALILCPTRELAQQVSRDAINLKGKRRGFRVATIMGGMPYRKQVDELQGCDLLVATPGRLLDLYSQRALSLSEVRFFVLDEADRMLDLGFSEDLKSIFSECKNIEQALMFSATFPKRVMSLAENMMHEPHEVALSTSHQAHTNIHQTVNWADDLNHQYDLLVHWLNDTTMEQCLIFASTQIETENLADELRDAGYDASALHGGMPQAARNRRLESLRRNRLKILVATDVAARGIDVATITHVINYGLPMKPEDYVHRIGRTGRAGRNGLAITLANPRDRRKLMAIEQYINAKLVMSEIEGLEPKTKISDKPLSNERRGGRGGRPDSSARRRDNRGFSSRSGTAAPRSGAGGEARSERSFDAKPRSFAGARSSTGGERSSAPRSAAGGERSSSLRSAAGAPRSEGRSSGRRSSY